MKKVISVIVGLVFAMSVQAGTVVVVEGTAKIAEGSNNALSVIIYETDFEEVLKDRIRQNARSVESLQRF